MTAAGSDTFAGATPFDYGSSSEPTPSGVLTTEAGEPNLSGPLDRTAWWTFTAPATETVGIDTLLTEIDATDPANGATYIHVYTGTVIGALTLVASGQFHSRLFDPDGYSPFGYLAEIDFNAVEGTTYHVRVSSHDYALDMDYVLTLGKRVITYSAWIQAPDYEQAVGITGAGATSASWLNTSAALMQNKRGVTRSVSAIADASWNSVLNAQFKNALTELSGYMFWNNSGTSPAVDSTVQVMDTTGASGVTNSRNLSLGVNCFAGVRIPNPVNVQGFNPLQLIGSAIPMDYYADYVELNPADPPGGNRAAVSGAHFTKKQTKILAAHRSGSSPIGVSGAFHYSLLRGSPSTADATLWDFSDRVTIQTINFSSPGSGAVYEEMFTTLDDTDVSDCVDETGRFVMVHAWPAMLSDVNGVFAQGGFDLSVGHGAVGGVFAQNIITYVFHPPRHRYVYKTIQTAVGVLKVWSEAAGEWLWQGEGSVSGHTGVGRFKVWDGDEWRIAEPVSADGGVGRLKIWDGTGWRTTVPG